MTFNFDQPLLSKGVFPAEGIIEVDGSDQFNEIMTLLDKVSEHQKVFLSGLQIENLDIHGASLNDDASSDLNKFLFDILEARIYSEGGCEDSEVIDFLQLCIEVVTSGDNPNVYGKLLTSVLENAPENITEDPSVQLIGDILHRKNSMIGETHHCSLLANLFYKLHLSQNFGNLTIENCFLSSNLFTHLVKQLYGCIHLKILVLWCTTEVPLELGDAIATIKSLQEVMVSGASENLTKSLVSGLSQCHRLK